MCCVLLCPRQINNTKHRESTKAGRSTHRSREGKRGTEKIIGKGTRPKRGLVSFLLVCCLLVFFCLIVLVLCFVCLLCVLLAVVCSGVGSCVIFCWFGLFFLYLSCWFCFLCVSLLLIVLCLSCRTQALKRSFSQISRNKQRQNLHRSVDSFLFCSFVCLFVRLFWFELSSLACLFRLVCVFIPCFSLCLALCCRLTKIMKATRLMLLRTFYVCVCVCICLSFCCVFVCLLLLFSVSVSFVCSLFTQHNTQHAQTAFAPCCNGESGGF